MTDLLLGLGALVSMSWGTAPSGPRTLLPRNASSQPREMIRSIHGLVSAHALTTPGRAGARTATGWTRPVIYQGVYP